MHTQHVGTEDRRNGFTLLELVVAMTVLSLVMLIVGNGFRLAQDSWEKGEKETNWTQRLRVLSGLMSQQLKSAYRYAYEIDNEKVAIFRGEADSVLFVTSVSDVQYKGFKWVRYSFSDGVFLYKEGRLPDKQLMEKISGDEEIIDEAVESVTFSYLSAESGEWKESWEFGTEVPSAVEVNISNLQPFIIDIPAGSRGEDDNEAASL